MEVIRIVGDFAVLSFIVQCQCQCQCSMLIGHIEGFVRSIVRSHFEIPIIRLHNSSFFRQLVHKYLRLSSLIARSSTAARRIQSRTRSPGPGRPLRLGGRSHDRSKKCISKSSLHFAMAFASLVVHVGSAWRDGAREPRLSRTFICGMAVRAGRAVNTSSASQTFCACEAVVPIGREKSRSPGQENVNVQFYTNSGGGKSRPRKRLGAVLCGSGRQSLEHSLHMAQV
jgi:hypothetical protein